MCNPDRIASILIGAIAAIAIAIACYFAVIGGGSNWYTSGGNPFWMIAAGVALGVAIGVVGAAANQAATCRVPPCKTFGDRLFYALTGLATSLTLLLAAGVAAAFPSAFPWLGSSIGTILSVLAIAAGATLAYICGSVLPTLVSCLGAPVTTVQNVASGAGVIVGILLVVIGAATLFGVIPFPFPPPVG